MKAKERDLLKRLLTNVRVFSLGVLVEGKSYVSVLPFVMTEEHNPALVHAWDLAAHSKGLHAGAPFVPR